MIDWLEEILRGEEPAVVIPGGTVGVSVPRRAEPPGEAAAAVGTAAAGEHIPLTALYRQMGQPAGALTLTPPVRRDIAAEEREAFRPGITARELDLAVRRDSRRYDGGMSIY